MKSLLNLIIVILIIQNISAQVNQANLDAFYQEYMNAKRRNTAYFDKIHGSPYSDPGFKDAQVFLKDNSTFIDKKLRYNELFDEMEMIEDGSDEFLIVKNKQDIDSILIPANQEIFRYMVYMDKEDYQQGYLIQLVKGKCNLFLKKTREFQPEKKAAAYQDYVPPSIIIKPDIFLVNFGNNPPIILPQSSKKIINTFLQNGYDLTEFTVKKNIKYNSESLIEIVNLCNSHN